MDKRHANFLMVAALILLTSALLTRWLSPQRPPAAQPVAQQEQQPAGEEQPPQEQPADARPAADEAVGPADKPAAEQPVAEEENVEPAWAVLGSADPNSQYRMLVTFTNQGAAIERIELNQPLFTDLDTLTPRGGYMGHLALTTAEGDEGGCLVRVVGPGTPADAAGIRVGDIIRAIGDRPVKTLTQFNRLMLETEQGQSIALTLDRDGAAISVKVALRRYPLEVVRPENSDPLSYLTTLARVGEKTLTDKVEELAGVGLRSAMWELLPADPQDPNLVAFRRRLPQHQLEIIKRYRLAELPADQASDAHYPAYHLLMQLEVRNLSDKPTEVAWRIDGPTGLPTEGWWYSIHSKISPRWWSSAGLRDVVAGLSTPDGGLSHQMLTCSGIADGQYRLTGPNPIAYIGVDAQYFASVLIPLVTPAEGEPSLETATPLPPSRSMEMEWTGIRVGAIPEIAYRKKLTNVTFRVTGPSMTVAANGSWTTDYCVFAGPKKPTLLAQYARPYGLGWLVEYGWFWWVAIPMQWVLHFFATATGNYGIAILMLTILVRSAMFPLSRNQALNAQKMQELQPELKRISETYKNNLEARGKAQQELFKKHNYNPFSGCLPMFIQLPIFIGLYRALSVDVELRQAPLISESFPWATNLAAPDMLFRFPEWLPQMLTGPDGYLGPYFNLLPCITIALFLLQQKMFMPPPTDEQAAMQQKVMQYMMIFICVMFFKVPSGLCVYFIASSLWSVAERKLLPKMVKRSEETPAPAPDPKRTKRSESKPRKRR